jgi:phosphohistidine phosphatase
LKEIKKIYLLRHAKSSNRQGLEDIDRPLNETGYTEAYTIANKLLESDEAPEIIISSPAVRAYSTALIFGRVLYVSVIIDQRLYEIPVKELENVITNMNNDYKSVMLVGHNPSFSQLAASLNSGIEHIPTTGIIRFDFEIDSWEKFSFVNPHTGIFLYPGN